LPGIFNAFSGSEISFQEMTAPGLSPSHQDGVGPSLKALQNMKDINTTSAEIFNDSNTGRILHPGRAGHIRGGIGAISAHKSQNFGQKVHFEISSLKLLALL
jgi:hypothetical protein